MCGILSACSVIERRTKQQQNGMKFKKVSKPVSQTKAPAVTEELVGGIKIIDNMELPPLRRQTKYPFATMRVGQGFVVPSLKRAASLYAAARKAGVKISARVTAEGVQCVVVRAARSD